MRTNCFSFRTIARQNWASILFLSFYFSNILFLSFFFEYTFSKFFFQCKIKSTQVGFEPETLENVVGGQENFFKFFQKEIFQ
jgi:hypothetical protein